MPPVAQASLKPDLNSTTHIHQIYIKAEPGAIWDHITSPEWSGKYGYRGTSHYDLRPGGKFRCMASERMRGFGLPELIIDGEVLEVSPPHRLVQTYRWLFNDAHKAEGFTRLTFEIEETGGGFCRLTVTHDTTGAPMMHAATQTNFNQQGGGGWDWILSDLKTLLETGKAMSA